MMTKALTLISKLPTGFSYSNESIASWHDYLQWVAKKKLAFRLVYIALDFHILKTQTSVNFHTFYWHFSCSRVSVLVFALIFHYVGPNEKESFHSHVERLNWYFQSSNIKLSSLQVIRKGVFYWTFNGYCTVLRYSSLSSITLLSKWNLALPLSRLSC